MENGYELNYIDSIDKARLYNLNSSRFKSYSNKTEKIIAKAKKGQRSDLGSEEWFKYSYWKDDWCQSILRNPPISHLNIEYENYSELSIENFKLNYESLDKPFIIRGATLDWEAKKKWNFEVK